jgi:hypothetical protein
LGDGRNLSANVIEGDFQHFSLFIGPSAKIMLSLNSLILQYSLEAGNNNKKISQIAKSTKLANDHLIEFHLIEIVIFQLIEIVVIS